MARENTRQQGTTSPIFVLEETTTSALRSPRGGSHSLSETASRTAVGKLAVGAFAIGALACGAAAIGALAVGRLAVGRARFGRLEVDDLTVGRLRLKELRTDGRSSQSPHPAPQG